MMRLDENEKAGVGLTDAGKALVDEVFDTTCVRTINIINESGLYSLILGLRKPAAKPFNLGITHDVIPSTRKNGVISGDK